MTAAVSATHLVAVNVGRAVARCQGVLLLCGLTHRLDDIVLGRPLLLLTVAHGADRVGVRLCSDGSASKHHTPSSEQSGGRRSVAATLLCHAPISHQLPLHQIHHDTRCQSRQAWSFSCDTRLQPNSCFNVQHGSPARCWGATVMMRWQPP